MSSPLDVVESSIAELREALDTGRITAMDLPERYLDRIAVYDHAGIRLNVTGTTVTALDRSMSRIRLEGTGP